MKLLVTIAVVVALLFGGAGVAYRFVHDRADRLVHEVIDTKLPERVKEQPWSPVVHGRAMRRDTVRFAAGSVVTVRCHLTLGSYSLSIVHAFSFQSSTSKIPAGCPGALVRRALTHATHVSESQDKPPVLTFDDKSGGHTVLTLRGARS